MVIARTVGGGDIAFLTGHAPFIGALDIGAVTDPHGRRRRASVVAVHGGFVEVSDDTGDDPVRRGRAGRPDRRRAGPRRPGAGRAARRRPTHDAEADAALQRAHVRLAARRRVRHRTEPHAAVVAATLAVWLSPTSARRTDSAHVAVGGRVALVAGLALVAACSGSGSARRRDPRSHRGPTPAGQATSSPEPGRRRRRLLRGARPAARGRRTAP